jgi:hypothetical protein
LNTDDSKMEGAGEAEAQRHLQGGKSQVVGWVEFKINCCVEEARTMLGRHHRLTI